MSGESISKRLLPPEPANAAAPTRQGPTWVEFVGLAIISFALSGVMAICMTLFAIGLTPGYPVAVLASWGLGFVVSFPAAVVIVPPVVKWQIRQTARNAKRK